MSNYQVTLLGRPGVLKKGEIIRFPYRKAEGIFYYLCVEKNASRDELVSIFWGAGDEDSGRKNLRQALFHIRRCMGENIIVLQGRNDLKLNQKCGIRTDWDIPDSEFFLCRERFLDFFYLKNCPEFEAWVDKKRNRQISRSLGYLEEALKDPSLYRDLPRLNRLIETWQYWRPWDEEMVLAGMKAYVQAEKYDLGIYLYHEYVKCLQRDLDEEPSHAVELLFRMLLHRKKVSLMRRPNCKDNFFGRQKELQYIDERLFLFLNNETTVSVIIEGEMGVGKTALMQQIFKINCDTGVLNLISHCYGIESEIPMKSWRDFFLQLENLQSGGNIHLSENSVRLLSLVLSGMATENTNVLHGGDERMWQNYALLENYVLNLFKELVSQWKIILYFDSLHWMDMASQRLLQRIMIEFGNDHVFMIATCRVEEEKHIRGLLLALSERAIITVLSLSCFTEAETEEIMNDVLQDREDGGINAHEMFQRTAGNPLVLMETLNMIRQEGWKNDRPLPRIDMLIQLRLDRLTSQQRRVLDALSIHMKHANLEDLSLLVDIDPMELIEVLEQLLLTGFVTEHAWGNDIVYTFKYQFYKDYVYQNLSLGKKRLWHHAVAAFYDKQKRGDRRRILMPYIMRHYEYSGDMERIKALRNLQKDM